MKVKEYVQHKQALYFHALGMNPVLDACKVQSSDHAGNGSYKIHIPSWQRQDRMARHHCTCLSVWQALQTWSGACQHCACFPSGVHPADQDCRDTQTLRLRTACTSALLREPIPGSCLQETEQIHSCGVSITEQKCQQAGPQQSGATFMSHNWSNL